jgi:D-glycero-D-manno-heptose 1,7-bisphosphate phosphatase
LRKSKAKISAFYFCPHHPDATLKKYRKKCPCRKPGPGLFRQAARDFSLNLKGGLIVGDMTTDVFAGKKLGMTTVLLLQGHRGLDRKYKISPNFKAKNLKETLRIIKKMLCKQ